MSAIGFLIEKQFAGNANPLAGMLMQYDSATSPNGVVTAARGTFLCISYVGDNSHGDCYINTDGSTTWAQTYNPV